MSQSNIIKDDDNQVVNGMVRGLQNRHVQLIAIMVLTGTGLFPWGRASLSLTGPSNPCLFICWQVSSAVPHDASYQILHGPDQHTLLILLKYLGKGWFFPGWSYWVSLVFLGMQKLRLYRTMCISKLPVKWFRFTLIILSRLTWLWLRFSGKLSLSDDQDCHHSCLDSYRYFMVATNFETPAGYAILMVTQGFQDVP